MSILLVESSAGITLVEPGIERRNICEVKLELVGAVKLASSAETKDGVKGQIYNKGEARTRFPLVLESAPSSLLRPSHGQ